MLCFKYLLSFIGCENYSIPSKTSFLVWNTSFSLKNASVWVRYLCFWVGMFSMLRWMHHTFWIESTSHVDLWNHLRVNFHVERCMNIACLWMGGTFVIIYIFIYFPIDIIVFDMDVGRIHEISYIYHLYGCIWKPSNLFFLMLVWL